MQGEVEPRENPYDLMELTSERTNLMQKITNVTGFATKKDSKKTSKGDTSSPKVTGKGKSLSGTAGKSTGKKKGAGKDAIINTSYQGPVVIGEPICQPLFRYIPDRTTVQRLVTRCANLKDDVIKFDSYEEKEKIRDGNDLI